MGAFTAVSAARIAMTLVNGRTAPVTIGSLPGTGLLWPPPMDGMPLPFLAYVNRQPGTHHRRP
jgi:hypothetical protein